MPLFTIAPLNFIQYDGSLESAKALNLKPAAVGHHLVGYYLIGSNREYIGVSPGDWIYIGPPFKTIQEAESRTHTILKTVSVFVIPDAVFKEVMIPV